MKSNYLLTIILSVIIMHSYGQYIDVTINTHRSSTVGEEFIETDFTSAEAAARDNLALTAYPSAILLQTSTMYYNCHGFAWHIIEGGNNVWIIGDNQSGDNGLLPYIQGTNASYEEVASPVGATKIAYEIWNIENQFSHSAIPTSHPDTVISKWGEGPLVKHHYADCEYYGSLMTLKYYKLKVDDINGHSQICDQETYSIPYLSPTTDVTWSASSSININSSGNGQATASPATTTNYSNNESVSAVVKTVYENIDEGVNVEINLATKTKSGIHVSTPPNNVQIHVPATPIYGDEPALVWASSNPGDATYTWQVIGGSIISQGADSMYFVADCPSAFGVTVKVKATNSCGESPYITQTESVDCSGGINPLSITPNPASGETTISIESNSEELGLKSASTDPIFDDNVEWDIEVYSPTQSLKEKKTKIKGKNTKIQTHGWKEGVYMVRALYKDQVLMGKLVVKK